MVPAARAHPPSPSPSPAPLQNRSSPTVREPAEAGTVPARGEGAGCLGKGRAGARCAAPPRQARSRRGVSREDAGEPALAGAGSCGRAPPPAGTSALGRGEGGAASRRRRCRSRRAGARPAANKAGPTPARRPPPPSVPPAPAARATPRRAGPAPPPSAFHSGRGAGTPPWRGEGPGAPRRAAGQSVVRAGGSRSRSAGRRGPRPRSRPPAPAPPRREACRHLPLTPRC